jgi:predicted nucleic acid-binding protein
MKPMPAEQREFLDTNYAFSMDPRSAPAEKLLTGRRVTSVQALNEFANVAGRKLAMSWAEVSEALAILKTLCPTIVPMDIATHAQALIIAERNGLAVLIR